MGPDSEYVSEDYAMLSSLPLQILFFFNGWYDVAFTIAMSCLFAWKGSTLPYPDELRPMLGLEVAIVFLLAIIEYARIFLGTKGNKTEQSGPLLMSLVLGVPAMIANVYFLRLQIYVTRADLVRCGPELSPPPNPPHRLRSARGPTAEPALTFRLASLNRC